MSGDTTTDPEIARAQALGRAAGRAGLGLSANPYHPTQRALRARWTTAYTGEAFDTIAGSNLPSRLRRRVAQWWNGAADGQAH